MGRSNQRHHEHDVTGRPRHGSDYLEVEQDLRQTITTGDSSPRRFEADHSSVRGGSPDRTAIVKCRFDERLALYGWQEDQDYTSQVRTYGRTIYLPDCRGVHLGSKSGRTSGLRFGYSQMANPLYLARKGTMSARKSTRFVVRHLLANSARSLRFNPLVDYRGRLRGNLLAIADMLRGRCDPRRVLELP